MAESNVLNLSIGTRVTRSSRTSGSFSGSVTLLGREVEVFLSADAVAAANRSKTPVLAQMELYFSCLVRKQIRFVPLDISNPDIVPDRVNIVPGLFTSFRAVCTRQCVIADLDGQAPPVETMPVKKPGQFMPDWLRIDYRAGNWLGEYGFARNR